MKLILRILGAIRNSAGFGLEFDEKKSLCHILMLAFEEQNNILSLCSLYLFVLIVFVFVFVFVFFRKC